MTEYDFSPEGYRRHMEKQDVVRRWAEKTGQFYPANPFTPTTPAVQAMALQGRDMDGYRSDREYRDRDRGDKKKSGSGHKHRSRSMGGSPTPPNHSRSSSFAYAQAPSPTAAYGAPVIPGPLTSSYPHHPGPKRSSTMPMPPPVPPFPPQPRRSKTSATSSHNTNPNPVYYAPAPVRPGEPTMIIPQGGSITIIPPGSTRPQLVRTPVASPPLSPRHHTHQQQYFPPQHQHQQQQQTPRKSILSKIGSFFSSSSRREQSPSGVVYVHSPPPEERPRPKRSKSSKHRDGKSRSSRHRERRGERRYSY
ncbi:hypothetical protein PQX77_010924 [Marasmius sp. AFHP31]|nr:hypothetical protein PQX77_010924 [Marasmius sp. AFHP31]